jgi:hypothetical protein
MTMPKQAKNEVPVRLRRRFARRLHFRPAAPKLSISHHSGSFHQILMNQAPIFRAFKSTPIKNNMNISLEYLRCKKKIM